MGTFTFKSVWFAWNFIMLFYKVDLKINCDKAFSHNSEQDTYSRDIRILEIYCKFGTKQFELTDLYKFSQNNIRITRSKT